MTFLLPPGIKGLSLWFETCSWFLNQFFCFFYGFSEIGYVYSVFVFNKLILTPPDPCIPESSIKSINLKFPFLHIFVVLEAFIKPFEAPQISVKIKIQVNFLSSSGIGTGRINKLKYNFIVYHAFNFIEQYVNVVVYIDWNYWEMRTIFWPTRAQIFCTVCVTL